MSQLRIRHETVYTYSQKVRFGPHRLVIRPREGHDVRVEAIDLAITPAARVRWIRDVFGNSVALVRFSRAAAELRIASDVRLTRTAPYRHREQDQEATRFPPVYDPMEIAVVAAYQQLSYPADAPAVTAWMETHGLKRLDDVEKVVAQLNRCVHRNLRYARREEKGVLTPSQTIERGTGSCRDFATLLLDAARSLGIAARFASGYLDCAGSDAGRASTHAWVEIYLPGHGWRGYDPTLGTVTDDRHVATGLSNHPRGVMPISGSFYGKASAFKAMAVTVRMSAD